MIYKDMINFPVDIQNLENCHIMDNFIKYNTPFGMKMDKLFHEYDTKILLVGSSHKYFTSDLVSLLD